MKKKKKNIVLRNEKTSLIFFILFGENNICERMLYRHNLCISNSNSNMPIYIYIYTLSFRF